MTFGTEMINNIVEKIFLNELPYVDNVIIGDNSSGKTLLLKHFIKRVKSTESIYFIDTVNRGFDVKKNLEVSEKAGI